MLFLSYVRAARRFDREGVIDSFEAIGITLMHTGILKQGRVVLIAHCLRRDADSFEERNTVRNKAKGEHSHE